MSNNITTYANMPELINMPEERNNKALAQLFKTTISDINRYNSVEMQQQRIDYAREHTYSGNVNKIESFINSPAT